jgi:hypothetical protein
LPHAPDTRSTQTNSTLKNRSGSSLNTKVFKELLAALEAVTRVLQTLVDVFNPPATPATTPKEMKSLKLWLNQR